MKRNLKKENLIEYSVTAKPSSWRNRTANTLVLDLSTNNSPNNTLVLDLSTIL